MIHLLFRAAPARVRAAPALTLLPVAAIALGVGAVLAIQLLNRAALDTLDASLEAVSGGADFRLEGQVLEPGAVPDEAWPRALAVPGVESAAPLVRLGSLSFAAGEGRRAAATAYGVDLLSTAFGFARPSAGGSPAAGSASGATPFFDPDLFFRGGVALPAAAAARLGVGVGHRVVVGRGAEVREVPVAGLVNGGEAAFLDLAYAQALRGRAGLDRIEFRLAAGADREAVAAALAERFPGLSVGEPATLRQEGADLFAAFRLNLTALAAVSLLVAAFLVYASVRAGLAARRREIGLYRALGASARATGWMLAGELALSALAGALLGAPLGVLAARAGLDRVSRTITNFYLLDRIEKVAPSVEIVGVALLVGVLAALAAALPEIRAEVRQSPVSLLAPGRELAGRRFPGRRAAALGFAFVGAGALPLLFPGVPLFALGGGFPAAGALVVGAALLPAGALSFLGPALSRAGGAFGSGTSFGRGAAAALREPGATAPAAAALVVAVTMLVGVTGLVGSLRRTLEIWLDETLAADLYVSRFGDLGRGIAERRQLPEEALAVTAADPAVADRDLLRGLRVRLAGRPVSVYGIDLLVPRSAERFSFLEGAGAPMAQIAAEGVLVSEPLARALGLSRGSPLSLPTPGGPAEATVAGVYRDYGSQTGALFLDRRRLDRLYPVAAGEAPPVHGAALYLRPGAEPAAVAARLRASLAEAGAGSVEVVDRRALRAAASEVFDRTMAVTALLRGFALFIAALGVGLLLWTMARERRPESALLRALGADSGQVAAGFLGRGCLIASLGLVCGGAAGALLAVLLVEVVNPAWFGWTLELSWPAGALASQSALVLVAGLAAAALPARQAARSANAAALREEI